MAINGYAFKGFFKTDKEQDVFLQEKITAKKFKTIKTSKVVNNSFLFTGNVSTEKIYYIAFKGLKGKIPVIGNNFETLISVNPNEIEKSVIKGSPLQTSFENYQKEINLAKNKFVFKLNYIKSHPNEVLSTIILKGMLGKSKWRLGQNRKAYKTLSSNLQSSLLGKEIDTYIKTNEPKVEKEVSVAELSLDPKVSDDVPVKIIEKKKTASITPYRKKAPNFYGESISGKDISLKSIIRNKKITLIDFWASWCGPCRNQNPHLRKLYKKYHSKGFEIVGVSEDKYADINKWKNAVANDQLPWKQIIDDGNRIANMFGVKGLPHTVLLDSKGGIIFAKKSSYTIEKELIRVFGF